MKTIEGDRDAVSETNDKKEDLGEENSKKRISKGKNWELKEEN